MFLSTLIGTFLIIGHGTEGVLHTLRLRLVRCKLCVALLCSHHDSKNVRELTRNPDVCLIEQYYDSVFYSFGPVVGNHMQAIRASDNAPKPVKVRDSRALRNVRYKVGQVFQHRRYQYNAIIVGWDVECAASEQWISQMRVRDLPQGQHQSFYHALVEDESTRYVAEENIEIVRRGPNSSLMALAGQYCKRWDENTKTFVNNIEDEYPDG